MDFNVENYLSNLSYINKDFESLWNEILETVPKLTNKWLPSEANESDPLVVLLKELAIIADKLNYNIDKNILELFPATLTQLRSAYNVYESLGYTPDWYVSATTGITITYTGMVGGERISDGTSTASIIIPKWTQVSDEEGEIIYTLMEDVKDINGKGVIPGTPGKFSVRAMQGTLNDLIINGSNQITITNLDAQNRLYFNETNIAQNGIIISNFSDFSDYNYEQFAGDSITENNNYEYYNKWRRVENLNQYTAGNKIYKLGIDSVTNNVYIQFPDDIGNLIGNGIYIKYILSNGSEGNIGKNDITQFINIGNDVFTNESSKRDEETATTLQATDFVVTNTKSAQNGVDPLDIEEMRREFNKTVGIFNTLVTLRDYENYIYEYETNDGNNIVSNIRVSDRYTDLVNSLTYKTMNSDGQFSDDTINVGIVSEIGNMQTITSSMTAYELKLYPLPAVNPIETKADLDKTFTTPTDTLDITTEIEDAISSVKCISHDFTKNGIGSPVLIPYDLNGQIYLQSAVSSEEAAEIAGKVQSKLLQTLNSRELEWGEQIDYGNVIDNIEAADNRIQYVALDAISYKKDGITLPNDERYDVIERNILAGNKSWTDYDSFLHNYGETNTATYSKGKVTNLTYFDPETQGEKPINNATIDGVNSIETSVTIEAPKSGNYNSYLVNENETLTILIPQYNTVTTYSNYLYYVAVGDAKSYTNSEGNVETLSTKTIPAATPYILQDNECIYIFETRDAAQAFCNGRNKTLASYILDKGTVINASANIKLLTGQLNNNSYVNMGSSITIDILERATGILRTSNNIAANINTSTGLRIATNSQGLIDALKDPGNEYTLLADEYLFYTDDLGIELGIISEGTTLSTNTVITDINKMEADNTEDLLDGSKLSGESIWKDIINENTIITYKLNKLSTFGSNYLVAFMNRSTSTEPINDLDTGEKTGEKVVTTDTFVNVDLTGAVNKFLNLDEKDEDGNTKINLIKYVQLTEAGELPTNSATGVITWEELERTLGDDPYGALIRLSLTTGMGVAQEVISQESKSFNIGIEEKPQNILTPITSQNVKITFNATKDGETINAYKTISADSTNEGKIIQSSKLISYQGGAPFKLIKDEQDVTFYVYDNTILKNSTTGAIISLNYDDAGFINIAAVTIENLNDENVKGTFNVSLTTPNIKNCPAIIPFTELNDSTVKYLAVKENTSFANLSFTITGTGTEKTFTVSAKVGDINIAKLGRPYTVNPNATYYNKNSTNESKYDTISSLVNNSYIVLNTDNIYLLNYCPIYQPTEEDLIKDPTEASSYFLDQHPYNRYVLPKLDNINIIISPLSITK